MKKVLTTTLAIAGLVCLIGAGVLPAADFDGDSRDDIAIFRPSTGLWAVRGVTRAYFGGTSDTPVAGDYNGDGIADIGIYRGSSGLWAIQGVTRIYFGGSSDTPVAGGGGGQRTYDYVVKRGDGADLVAALENTTYASVFIPSGTYSISEVINVPTNIRHIIGESNSTIIQFAADGDYLSIEGSCHIEELRFTGGGDTSPSRGAIYIDGNYVTIENCRSVDSLNHGFQYSSNANYVSFVNCVVRNAATDGFSGSVLVLTSRMTNCSAYNCAASGFVSCRNLSSCVVDGNNNTANGFWGCLTLSACQAYYTTFSGYYSCYYLSACMVDGESATDYGFHTCHNLSSCHVEDTTSTPYLSCFLRDPDSCD